MADHRTKAQANVLRFLEETLAEGGCARCQHRYTQHNEDWCNVKGCPCIGWSDAAQPVEAKQ